MALNANSMGSEVVAAIATLSDTDKQNATLVWQKICGAIVDHIVANMEVNGIETTLDQSLQTIFNTGVPVPNDGGAALKTAWIAATAGGVKDDATQNNDGTGRVA